MISGTRLTSGTFKSVTSGTLKSVTSDIRVRLYCTYLNIFKKVFSIIF